MLKHDLTTPLLPLVNRLHQVDRETLATAGGLSEEQARWVQKALVFHGVCAGSRDAWASPVVDPRALPEALRALDATRAPLTRDQKQRLRTFVTHVHMGALAPPTIGLTRAK